MQCVTKRRWLILLVETKARELYAKMLLALVAAEQGWGVVLGSKSALRNVQAYLPRGTFLEKGVTPSMATNVERGRALGHRVSALCEEGLLYFATEEYLDLQSFEAIDYFFAWGDRQAADVRSVIEGGYEKVVVSGNPRLDLVRPEWRGIFEQGAKQIREQYGSIILVNTKFSQCNHIVRTIGDYTDHLKAFGKIGSREHEALWRRYVARQERVFRRVLDLLPALSHAFKGHTIILRPHPSEDNAPWFEKAKGLSNVKVVWEGNVLEWITAADVVLQSNCFTGVEACLLGKPSISYRPFKDEMVEFEIPRKAGLQASTQAEVLSLVQGVLCGDATVRGLASVEPEATGQYIANVDGRLASDVIMETLSTLDLPLCEGRFPIRPNGVAGALTRLKVLPIVKSMLTYNRKKFRRLDLAEMERLRADFQQVSGRFTDVEITQATDDGFCVYRP